MVNEDRSIIITNFTQNDSYQIHKLHSFVQNVR